MTQNEAVGLLPKGADQLLVFAHAVHAGVDITISCPSTGSSFQISAEPPSWPAAPIRPIASSSRKLVLFAASD